MYKRWFFFLLLMCFSLSTQVLAANVPSGVDIAEVQQFEQSYETWLRQIIYSTTLQTADSLLVKIDYSNDPEKIQTYEEAKSELHLPGLPNVVDPHFSYPAESPLYSLINQQNIKILFSNSIPSEKQKLLREVIQAKTKLNLANGDQLQIETADSNSNIKFEWPWLSSSKVLSLAGLLMAMSGLGLGLGFALKRKPLSTLTKNENSSVSFKNNEVVLNKISKRNPKIALQASRALNPFYDLTHIDPKIIISTIQNESAKNLAKAISHAPIELTELILRASTDKQKLIIKNDIAFQNQHITQSPNNTAKQQNESIFYQLLLISKCKRNASQNSNVAVAQFVDQFVNAQVGIKNEKNVIESQFNLKPLSQEISKERYEEREAML